MEIAHAMSKDVDNADDVDAGSDNDGGSSEDDGGKVNDDDDGADIEGGTMLAVHKRTRAHLVLDSGLNGKDGAGDANDADEDDDDGDRKNEEIVCRSCCEFTSSKTPTHTLTGDGDSGDDEGDNGDDGDDDVSNDDVCVLACFPVWRIRACVQERVCVCGCLYACVPSIWCMCIFDMFHCSALYRR